MARVVVAGLAVGLAAVAGMAPATAGSVVPDVGTNRLPSGHCLKTGPNHFSASLESRSGRFELNLFRTGQFTMDNNIDRVPGETWGYGYSDIWGFTPHTPSSTATLCMHRDGNLVLHAGARVEWQTHTSGNGAYAQLRDFGAFVVRTPDGRILWSSHSTAVLMIAGDTLASGRHLVNRTYPGSASRLEMKSNGNLVLFRSGTAVWQSHTHVRGSHLWITKHGRLVISAPAGQRVWSTAPFGHAIMRLAQRGRLVLEDMVHRTCWQRPLQLNCDEG